jgi:hypothetical protein
MAEAPVPGWVLALAARPVGQYAELIARLSAEALPHRTVKASKKTAPAKSRKIGAAQASATVSKPLANGSRQARVVH